MGGVQGVTLLNKYNGSYYAVSMDGDFQTWIYRKDLFEDAKERADFKAKYGWDLRFPETWDELDQVASFPSSGKRPVRLHRPAQSGLGLYQLVSALLFDGGAGPHAVRRQRQAADQFA